MDPFADLLQRRRDAGDADIAWVSRELRLQGANAQETPLSPAQHKGEVAQGSAMRHIVAKMAQDDGRSEEELWKQVKSILDEIGFDRKMPVIRWLGYALTKICKRVCSGIYVNENAISKVKSMMGNVPVILVPSHRSYADFILMSYICFCYDMELPVVATGMDFHAMKGMSRVLRNTGAFFMRRSFNDDKLYWDTFRQYVHQIVTKGEMPIEFFIEGTRSRSGKSLMPKMGLFSMLLKPFFTGEVPDMLIVPISISYDRVLEEKLFAYEVLGVPKPKESTSGLLKSMKVLKEKYGNIYIDLAEPISARRVFGSNYQRCSHSVGPLWQQELIPEERRLVQGLAEAVVEAQQRRAVLTTFNLAAVILMNNYVLGRGPMSRPELQKELRWLEGVFGGLGARTDGGDVGEALEVHRDLVRTSADGRLYLVQEPGAAPPCDPALLKGHALPAGVMGAVLPVVMLQLYVNPCMQHLVNPAVVTMVMRSFGDEREISKDDLYEHYSFVRRFLSHEFVLFTSKEKQDFEQSLKHLDALNIVVVTTDGKYLLGNHVKLQIILCNVLSPFLNALKAICRVSRKTAADFCQEKTILVEAQKYLEGNLNETLLYPYSLSLDTLTNCLMALSACGAMERARTDGKVRYRANLDRISTVIERLDKYSQDFIPDISEKFDTSMSVHLASKL